MNLNVDAVYEVLPPERAQVLIELALFGPQEFPFFRFHFSHTRTHRT